MHRFFVAALVCASLAVFSFHVAAAPDGAAVYQAQCAACHDNASGRIPNRAALNSMTADSILSALETGAMRVIGLFNLNGLERVAVAEHLGTGNLGSAYASRPNNCEATAWPAADAFSKPGWPSWGNGIHNPRFQEAAAAGVNKRNVGSLELAWAYAFPGETIVESQPTLLDGRLFTGTRNGFIMALDAKSGCENWRYQGDAAIKSSVALGQVGPNKRVVAVTGDIAGNIYALDAASGRLLWKIRGDQHPLTRIAGSPQFVGDTVLVPLASLEEGAAINPAYPCCTFRGGVIRVDARTGEILWKHYTVQEEPTVRGKNSAGADLLGPSGAAVWSAPTIDTKRGQVYISTGDNYSHPATDSSDAVLALSLETGEIVWRFQGLAGDVFTGACNTPDRTGCPEDSGPDLDMGTATMLLTLPNGKDILIAGQKSGIARGLDPDTGKVLWQRKVAEGGILGGIEWGMASAPGRAFISKSDVTWKNQEFISATTSINADTGGGLAAVDLASGEILWEAPPVSCKGREGCSPGQPAAVTAIPGVVFSGSLSGEMRAFDADNGEELWRFDTVRNFESVNGAAGRGGAIDGPGVVVVDGWVYVTSGYAKWGGLPGNVLLAFRVPDKSVAASK